MVTNQKNIELTESTMRALEVTHMFDLRNLQLDKVSAHGSMRTHQAITRARISNGCNKAA